MLNEQGYLRISIAATFVVATFGIVLGLLSGSSSISFDGVYSLGDAGMTALALWVSSLITRSAKREESMGGSTAVLAWDFGIWNRSSCC